MAAALRFLETAEARRQVIVVGTILDYPGDASRRYRAVARPAATHADQVVFVGRMATSPGGQWPHRGVRLLLKLPAPCLDHGQERWFIPPGFSGRARPSRRAATRA